VPPLGRADAAVDGQRLGVTLAGLANVDGARRELAEAVECLGLAEPVAEVAKQRQGLLVAGGSGGSEGCGGPAPSSSSAAASLTGLGLKYPPKPMRNVSKSRTVIGRLVGTVSSTGPSIRRTTRRLASSGSSASTGSSRRSTHSSRRIIAATAVTGLVIDEMRKIVSGRIGWLPCSAAAPMASMCTSPRRLIADTRPGAAPRPTWPAMMSCSRARRSWDGTEPVIAGYDLAPRDNSSLSGNCMTKSPGPGGMPLPVTGIAKEMARSAQIAQGHGASSAHRRQPRSPA
jgi:hypothetical protein